MMIILPFFALSNTGVPLHGISLSEAATHTVSMGIVFGLVFGKPIGVTLFSFLAVKFQVATLPENVRWSHILGAAMLGGIGFTEENFDSFQEGYNKYGFWIVFTCGFTPLPYKVCTITAGVAGIFFPGFLIASALSRSARFFIVAGLFGWKGEAIRPFIEKYFNWLSLAFVPWHPPY